MKSQRIAIVGAGTAGLASAALLARQGHSVVLFERAQSFQPVGTGVLLQPSGLGVLSELGVMDDMLRYGQRVDSLLGTTRLGRKIMQVEYAHLGVSTDLFGLGVHRAALCHVLHSAFASISSRVYMGCEVRSTEQQANSQLLHFLHNGQEHTEAFDAVLIANGSASTLRPATWVKYNKQYPWGAMWTIAPLTEQLTHFDQPSLQQKYDKAHTMVGMLPTGCSPDSMNQRMVSLFWSLPVADIPEFHNPDFDFSSWKQNLSEFWPEVSPLLDALHSPLQLLPATYRDVVLSRWGQGRLGVIGDAAHAMSPQLGQGANMALLDARSIADAIEEGKDWDDVWCHFHAQRAGSIRFYQIMSWLLTPLFQSRIPGAAFIRDFALPLSHKIPWLRQQMAATVAGTKHGLFR
ncbi:FAD-dependent oxidoreductase [Limnobacter sp.]|uniref:FAD-dependent oxidoreductase n=1 Tax=Limnobacter sp. TaxID=2003368 RepID=UPI002FE15815